MKPKAMAIRDAGLEEASRTAPSPLMREVARVALARGETLGAIAKRLNEEFKVNLHASNVRRHLISARPQDEIVKRYAWLIGMKPDELRFVAGVGGSAALVASEIRQVRRGLALYAAQYEASAVAAALRFIDEASAEDHREIASRHRSARASRLQYRASHSEELERALEHAIDLRSARRSLFAGESTLFELWLAAAGRFEPQECDAIVALGVGLLRRRGVDTVPLEDHLAIQRAASNFLGGDNS